MEDNGIEKLSDLVGLALPNIVPAEDLDRSFKLLPKFDEDACVDVVDAMYHALMVDIRQLTGMRKLVVQD